MIFVRDLRIQHQLIEYDLRTFMRFTIACCDERLQDIGRQDACQSRNGDEQRIRMVFEEEPACEPTTFEKHLMREGFRDPSSRLQQIPEVLPFRLP